MKISICFYLSQLVENTKDIIIPLLEENLTQVQIFAVNVEGVLTLCISKLIFDSVLLFSSVI
jgi:hypothetical protein